jgi:hypothetical protein
MSIFISIASYQDPLLVSTIFSAYNNAEKKMILFLASVISQTKGLRVDEMPFSNQIHYEHVDPFFQKGHAGQDIGRKVFLMGKTFFYRLTRILNLHLAGIKFLLNN